MEINKLIKLFLASGFLDASKLKHLDLAAAKKTLDILYNTDCAAVHRDWTIEVDGQLKAHISRIRLHGDTWLCHHHAAIDGYGAKVLARMILESVVDNVENIKYFCSFYRKENAFPNAVFGGVYRDVKDETLISEKDYGYAYLRPVKSDIYPNLRRVSNERDCIFRPELRDWPVKRYSFKYEIFINWRWVGNLYENFGAPGISLSSYTNSSIFELFEPITVADISNLIRVDVPTPTMWYPLNYLDADPEKVYTFWKAKIDHRLFKYFRALEGI
jgi:hypothetical protein